MESYETIAAISTAIGEAGISIVRMSGDSAIDIAQDIFRPVGKLNIREAENRKFLYGHIVDNDNILDEVLIVKFLGPHSYTAEDMVEIHAHGGIISVRRILNLLLKKGARLADRGEFTKRGFLNGRIDLTQAEAVIDMIKAKTEEAFDLSLNHLSGDIKNALTEIENEVISMQAQIIANIDFPEDDVDVVTFEELKNRSTSINEKLKYLIENSEKGKLLRDGINTIILGKPNVGKSSLLNKMLKTEKAIVTDIAGTTRDIIEDYINLDGILLKITDTAGIRNTEDKVEKIGVDIAKSKLNEADLVIAIFDISRKFDENDREIVKLIEDKKSIVILNKSDLEIAVSDSEMKKLLGDREVLKISIKNENGVYKIEEKIKEMFFNGEIRQENEVYLSNIRHINAVKSAKKTMEEVDRDIDARVFLDLIEVNLESVLDEISKITGAITTEDVLDRVFSEFCIGK